MKSFSMSTTNPAPRDSELSNSSLKTYLTFPVILKLIQIIAGIISVAIAAIDLYENFDSLAFGTSRKVVTSSLFRFIKPVLKNVIDPITHVSHLITDQLHPRIGYLAGSAILLVISLIQFTWFPVSIFSGPMKSRIISGVIYHLIGFGVQIAVSLYLLFQIHRLMGYFYNENLMLNAVYIGLANGGLYLLSAIIALGYLIGSSSCCSESRLQARRQFSGKRMDEMSP